MIPRPRYNGRIAALLIAETGLSVAAFAKTCDRLSHETLYQFLRGNTQTVKTAVKIAAALTSSGRRRVTERDLRHASDRTK